MRLPYFDRLEFRSDVRIDQKHICTFSVSRAPSGDYHGTLKVGFPSHNNPDALKDFFQGLIDDHPDFIKKVAELSEMMKELTRKAFPNDGDE